MVTRKLRFPPPNTETFFLWGPRQTGKTTLLRRTYPQAYWIDLLKADEYRRYLQNPERLREELPLQGPSPFVVIDEVQKVPQLLDEVHWLHENRDVHFALCGSSARKVRRGHANLLGGRAVRYELLGLSAAELGTEWNLARMINHGYLPRLYFADKPARLLQSYISDYLREEVAAEGLSRNLPAFSEFLNVAALADTQLVNMSTIARECGVSNPTVKAYFGILEDTLLGRWLPSYRARPKRRVIEAPKFYFSDVGVVNVLARRGWLEPGGELFGKAFENWVFHELSAYNAYTGFQASVSFWRLASGIEVDFIVNDLQVAVEAKASGRVTADHLKGLRHLAEEYSTTRRRILICLEEKKRRTEDGIEILPARAFVESLWGGKIF